MWGPLRRPRLECGHEATRPHYEPLAGAFAPLRLKTHGISCAGRLPCKVEHTALRTTSAWKVCSPWNVVEPSRPGCRVQLRVRKDHRQAMRKIEVGATALMIMFYCNESRVVTLPKHPVSVDVPATSLSSTSLGLNARKLNHRCILRTVILYGIHNWYVNSTVEGARRQIF